MERVLLIDNYDSFTFNLAHLLESLGAQFDVVRNDKISVESAGLYSRILLSPGPGIPSEAGNMPAIVKEYAASRPILGICLGHQCIGESFGGRLFNLPVPVHGKTSRIIVTDDREPLFAGLGPEFAGGRYHSWVVAKDSLPADLKITAVDDQGEIMALSHKSLNVKGVQFHPESVMTGAGAGILKNWLAE